MTVAVGTRLGPYELVALIGAGGMGQVYRARDARLGRDVAVKVLPEAFASDPDRLRRFEQEARAASAISHPNILVVHDVGSHDGVPYLVTELLEGTSLRERLAMGVLAPRAAIDVALQITSGLAAAHAKGIVHRDLKPENLFITADGRAKILDFGIAKAVIPGSEDPGLQEHAGFQHDLSDSPTVAATTDAGLVLGTAGYMSPEQVRGEPADARSDIFSLGCVLFEMLSGRKAFERQTGIETLHAILKDDPPPLVPASGSLPANLEPIVRRCLEKRPADRFASSSDLHFALQSLLEASASAPAVKEPPEKSIAVLPFENISADAEQDYFCDGMTEELIADLSKIRSLRVISRTSSMAFKGTKQDVPAIARDLHVRYVLEGSVRRAGQSLRITAQLIDAACDAHLWAEKYACTLDDVFEVQEKVSRAIVEALKVTLTADEQHRLAARMIPNARAFDLYLEARQDFYRLTEQGLDRALRLVQDALDIVGPNALLHSLAAECEFFYHDQGIHPDEDTLHRAESWAARALALDPTVAPAFRARGLVRGRRGDILGAIHDLEKARELQPSGEHLGYLAWFLAEVGRMREARVCAEAMVAVDPLLWFSHWGSAWVELLEGNFEAARDRVRQGAALGGDEPVLVFFTALSATYVGRLDEACRLFERVAEMEGSGISKVASALGALFRRDREAARALLEQQAVRDLATLDKEFSWWLAAGCGFAGETDEALHWLANAIDRGFVNHHFFSAVDPFLAALRGDPRFEALMERALERQRAFGVIPYSWRHGGDDAAR